ncbi:YncE family protein [Clostridium niameyense]|uniref:YncE family protein n=1 Tax=Clostridium niameyense TaxID=1622073 RepID=A0A6M0RBZ0_9CLOT|nr:YncE family protein [Clostridium niameyense]NEZ47702.1 YncE family protein [Clostridium niameyense]
MRHLYICNTSTDCISKVNIENFKEENKITLNNYNNDSMGPHGIYAYRGNILVTNSYNNTLSIVDAAQSKEVDNYFVGMHCNDVVAYEDKIYVICGDSDVITVFDANKKRILEQLPCGDLPHSIVINKRDKLIMTSNMGNDSITIVDCNDTNNIKNIRVGSYPTKAMFTVDGKYILVCESNIGSDYKGSIGIISAKNYRLLYRISVGSSPVDMYCDEKICAVSNFGDGTVSLVDINYYEEIKKIIVGGMPRGIYKFKDNLYVGDNYNNQLLKINITKETKTTIPIGGEPTGMIVT